MAKKRKQNKKRIYWILILILMVIAGVISYLVWNSYFNDKHNEVETVESSEQEEKESPAAPAEEGELTSEGIEKEKIVQYDGEDPNKAEELSGVVTYAGVNGSNLMIRVNIDQYLDSGSCELTLMRGGAIIYSSIANVIGNASTATCEGFDIPVSELGGGEIEINIKLSAGGRTGLIREEVNI